MNVNCQQIYNTNNTHLLTILSKQNNSINKTLSSFNWDINTIICEYKYFFFVPFYAQLRKYGQRKKKKKPKSKLKWNLGVILRGYKEWCLTNNYTGELCPATPSQPQQMIIMKNYDQITSSLKQTTATKNLWPITSSQPWQTTLLMASNIFTNLVDN